MIVLSRTVEVSNCRTFHYQTKCHWCDGKTRMHGMSSGSEKLGWIHAYELHHRLKAE